MHLINPLCILNSLKHIELVIFYAAIMQVFIPSFPKIPWPPSKITPSPHNATFPKLIFSDPPPTDVF